MRRLVPLYRGERFIKVLRELAPRRGVIRLRTPDVGFQIPDDVVQDPEICDDAPIALIFGVGRRTSRAGRRIGLLRDTSRQLGSRRGNRWRGRRRSHRMGLCTWRRQVGMRGPWRRSGRWTGWWRQRRSRPGSWRLGGREGVRLLGAKRGRTKAQGARHLGSRRLLRRLYLDSAQWLGWWRRPRSRRSQRQSCP